MKTLVSLDLAKVGVDMNIDADGKWQMADGNIETEGFEKSKDAMPTIYNLY